MRDDGQAVKRLEAALELGFSVSEAVQKALGRSLTQWAEEHGHRQSEVSMCLGGYPGRIYGAIRDDLAAELGIDRGDLDRLIDGPTEPATTEGAA